MVSHDVVFDETKGWNWKRSDSEQKSYNDFVVELGEFGNHKISEPATEAKPSDQPRGLEQTGDNRENEETGETEKDIIKIEDDKSEGGGESEVGGENRVLRRSERQTSRPKYLDDYVLLAEEEGEMLLLCLNGEPRTFEEASELIEWIEACEDELHSIEKNEVWTLVELPDGVKPIGLRWIFKIKRNADGSIKKYKARLVAKG